MYSTSIVGMRAKENYYNPRFLSMYGSLLSEFRIDYFYSYFCGITRHANTHDIDILKHIPYICDCYKTFPERLQ